MTDRFFPSVCGASPSPDPRTLRPVATYTTPESEAHRRALDGTGHGRECARARIARMRARALVLRDDTAAPELAAE